MKTGRKFHIFLIVLAGVLISVMLVMMRLGGSVNFQEFMSAGRVYDFEPVKLEKSTTGWLYDKENEGHWLQKDKAVIRFRTSKKMHRWGYLYLTVRELSMESVTGMLRYYDKTGAIVLEQPITLTQGRNIVPMDRSVSITRIGIALLDAKGAFISISDMQIRTKPSWFTVPHFLKLFAAALAGSLVLLGILAVCISAIRTRISGGREKTDGLYWMADAMQDVIRTFGDFLGSRMGGRLYPHQRDSICRFLLSILFVWMLVGNAAGWIRNPQVYRYHVLACCLLLLAVSFVSWEKPLKNQSWRGPLMKSWFFIWFGIIVCDLFIDRELESVVGYGMLISGSVFVYFWQNMEKPVRMLRNLMGALENTFFLMVGYCIFFRAKHPAIDYNGMFTSPEELAMYGVLMAVVFLTEMDWLLRDSVASSSGRASGYTRLQMSAFCVKNITGGALALFFVLRSAHALGIAIFILLGILYLPYMILRIYGMAKNCRILFLQIIVAAVFAYACVYIVFISTKYVPEILGMDMEYENELLLTELGKEEQELHLMQYPGSLEGVRTKDDAKLPIIWRNYARRLNLFGHSGSLNIFRREILPYNSYLDMAYHHGIFLLLPYIAFQVAVIGLGMNYAFRKKDRANIYLLFLGIAWLCFSFGSNVEISYGHPLWLCYYLSVGYLGRMERRKT